MKLTGLSVGILLFSAVSAQAQSAPAANHALLFVRSAQVFPVTSVSTAFSRDAPLASARPAPALPAPAPEPQGVQGVFPTLYWQGYVGYSFLRFYETPQTRVNTNGLEVSMAYFFKDWLAVEGEVDGGIGPQGNQTGKLVFGGPGLRARWAQPRSATEFWAHAVVGGAHFVPKTPYGSEGAFGYEIGGGIDLNSRHKRLAYRVEADVVGTMFFSTYQVNPKVSAGVVYKF
jgi:hypothetical protein